MSSKKKYTSVGIDLALWERLLQEAEDKRRSRSFIIEEALRVYLCFPTVGGEKGTVQNAK